MSQCHRYLPLLPAICWLLAPASGRAQTLYVSNYNENTVNIVTQGSTTGGTVFISGLDGPEGIAFDSQGNMYVANSGDGLISEYSSSGSLINASFASIGSDTEALGLAFNSSGDLFVADGQNNAILEVTPGGSVSTFVNSGLDQPIGLAFNSSGNLYVSDSLRNSIIQITPLGVESTFVNNSINFPYQLAVDANGNLDVAGFGYGEVSQVSPGGTLDRDFITTASGPGAVALDSSGDVFVATQSDNTISEYSSTGSLIDATYASGFNDPEFLAFSPAESSVPEPGSSTELIGAAAAMLALGHWLRRRMAMPTTAV